MNILLIAYFFKPDKKVGALRASYWYENLSSLMDCNVSVVTANAESKGEAVHVVPLSSMPPKLALNKDVGKQWSNDLKLFFEASNIKNPDVVIITGSPFTHFGIGEYLKNKFHSKIILDYRDPFAVNPGFKNTPFKIWVKKLAERRYNRIADGLVTVNKYLSLIHI